MNNERIHRHPIDQLHAGAIASFDMRVIDSTATSVSLFIIIHYFRLFVNNFI